MRRISTPGRARPPTWASRRGTCSGGGTSGACYQEFRLSAGAFAQEANPTRWTGSAGYEQVLRLTTESTLYYGVG